MADSLITVAYNHLKAGNILRSLGINVVANTLIAVLLNAIGYGNGFTVTLIFSQCIGMSIYFANLAVLPLFRKVSRPFHQVVLVMAAVLVGASFGTLFGALVNGISPLRFLREYFPYFAQIVLIGLFFGLLISYIYISLGVISGEKVRRLEAEKNSVEAEFRLLQSQMEPHFLFNTLSNVLSLIDTDREKAKRMLESFTLFLRTSLLTARSRTVPLSQEWEIVRNYLRVFEVRMGDRLRYSLELAEKLRDFPVPPLLVQPLVENAIKHGLEPAPEGGELSVRAVLDGPVVRIFVVDSGIGLSESGPGNGIGLDNIRKRLDLAYHGRGRLLIEENEPRGMRVVIEIPYEADTGSHSGR